MAAGVGCHRLHQKVGVYWIRKSELFRWALPAEKWPGMKLNISPYFLLAFSYAENKGQSAFDEIKGSNVIDMSCVICFNFSCHLLVVIFISRSTETIPTTKLLLSKYIFYCVNALELTLFLSYKSYS